MYSVHFLAYPFRYWRRVQGHEFRDKIYRERIVTDSKQKKALEANPVRLEFVAEWKEEGRIIKKLMEKEGKDKKIDDLAAASVENTVQFLREASVRRAIRRAVKMKSKATTTSGKQEDFFLEQWCAHGERMRLPTKDVVIVILPSSMGEDDRRVLEERAEFKKAKTSCKYQFEFS